jgi:hypothetical protein
MPIVIFVESLGMYLMRRTSTILKHLIVSLIGIVRDIALLIIGRKIGVPSTANSETNQWSVTVEEDSKTGELMLPLPVDVLSQMGWCEGTELFWIDNKDGSYTLTKNKDQNQE